MCLCCWTTVEGGRRPAQVVQIRVGAVVAALTSDLALQTLDEAVLLLQLFRQPARKTWISWVVEGRSRGSREDEYAAQETHTHTDESEPLRWSTEGEVTANVMLSNPTHCSMCLLALSATVRFWWTRKLMCSRSSSLSPSSSKRRLFSSRWIVAGLSGTTPTFSSRGRSSTLPTSARKHVILHR